MTRRTQGIILQIHPVQDTSCVVRWLTPDHGRIATIAKGARRPKSPFLGKLDLFIEADISYEENRRSALHTLREVAVLQRHGALARSLGALQVAAYLAVLIEKVSETDTPTPELHALMKDVLGHLDTQPGAPRVVYAAELRLLACQGLGPDPAEANLLPETVELMDQLLNVPWNGLESLRATRSTVQELRVFLGQRVLDMLGRIPEQRDLALTWKRPTAGPEQDLPDTTFE